METQTENQLKTLSFKDWAKQNNITSVAPVVRTNENGYPYVTMINANNEATNVYFSRAASQAVDAGTPITKELMKAHQIGITINAEGEERIKLISNSARIELDSLLD